MGTLRKVPLTGEEIRASDLSRTRTPMGQVDGMGSDFWLGYEVRVRSGESEVKLQEHNRRRWRESRKAQAICLAVPALRRGPMRLNGGHGPRRWHLALGAN